MSLEDIRNPWTPFKRDIPVNSMTKQPVQLPPGTEFFSNSRYVVFRRRVPSNDTEVMPDLVHLSIHDHQRTTRHDWRDFQRIKNELVGPECYGIEVFPPEADLVDSSNEFHLWVFDRPGFHLGIGFSGERFVLDDGEEPSDEVKAQVKAMGYDPDAKGYVQRKR